MTSPLAYPLDWEDEERMHYLLAAFSTSAASSLSAADRKVRFWSSLVHSACRADRRPVFSGWEMAQRLQWRGQTPACLQQVLGVMVKDGQLCLMRDMVEGAKRQGWVSWGASVLSASVRWVWGRYLSPSGLDTISEGVYVDVQLLQETASSVLQRLQSSVEFRNTDMLITGERFESICLEVVDMSSLDALELELKRQGRICSQICSGRKVVKFSSVADNRLPVVSDTDLHTLSLKEAIVELQAQTSSLMNKSQRFKDEARIHLQQNQRQMALSFLRRGRLVQSAFVKKTAMLDNLQALLQQIQMAETHSMVLEAYRKGAETLKAVSSTMLPGAEDAVQELHEALEQCEEVGDVLAGDTESDVLEKELEALLLSSAESSLQAPGDTEDSHLADQLSQLQLISPPATDPAGSSGAQLQRKTAASTLPMSHSKQKLM